MHLTGQKQETEIEKMLRYITERNATGVKALLIAAGYTVHNPVQSLLGYMRKSDDASEMVVRLHPDYELIASQLKLKMHIPTDESESLDAKKKDCYAIEISSDMRFWGQILMFLAVIVLLVKIIKVCIIGQSKTT